MKAITELIFYSNLKQRREIEDFADKQTCEDLWLLMANESLPVSSRMSRLKRLRIKNIDFYHGREEAREVVKRLHSLRLEGRSIFGEILTLDGHSILEIVETSFINDLLGPVLSNIVTVAPKIEQLAPDKIHIFKPYGAYEKTILGIFPQKIRKNGSESNSIGDPFSSNIWGLPFKFEVKSKSGILNIAYALLSNVSAFLEGVQYRLSSRRRCYEVNHSDDRKRVLFFTINKKQTDTIIPLVKNLESDDDLEPVVIDWGSNAVESLRENNITYEQFNSYFGLDLLRDGIRIARRIRYRWFSVKETSSSIRNIWAVGYDISSMVIEFLDRIFQFYVYSIVRDYLITREIVSRLNVDAIFVTNERESRAKSCVFAAKSCGVRTYNCQRGVIADHPEIGPISTDKMFVNGEFYERNLVRRGVDSCKIVVTGNPRFDRLYQRTMAEKSLEKMRKHLHEKLDIKPYEEIALIIAQPLALDVTVRDKYRMMRSSLKALSKLRKMRVIVKLHPSQKSGDIEKRIISELNLKNIILLRDEIDLHELLICSKFVIIRHSTVGLDTVLLGKPLLTTRLVERGRDLIPYAKSGVALEAETEEEMGRHIEEILSQQDLISGYENNRDSFVKHHLFKFDGKCTERVVKALKIDLQGKLGSTKVMRGKES